VTGDEFERAIDFLLKSQANLEARIEDVDRRLGARIEEVDQRLGARIEETNRQLAETNQQLGEYANMQTTLIQVVTRTYEAQAAINKRTDEKLNALIDTVNRMLSGGQGGNP
jgi:chromosome segregation ATPase